RRSTIRYKPWPSVRTVRTFSMSAGLAASTVTPGSTAPELSRTTPVIVPVARFWANAVNGSSKSAPERIRRWKQPFVIASPPLSDDHTQLGEACVERAHACDVELI